jgi:hypothetical protein
MDEIELLANHIDEILCHHENWEWVNGHTLYLRKYMPIWGHIGIQDEYINIYWAYTNPPQGMHADFEQLYLGDDKCFEQFRLKIISFLSKWFPTISTQECAPSLPFSII